MVEFCKFCGTPTEDGVCPNGHDFKKMCLNCKFCGENEEHSLICTEENNLNTAYEKILAAAKSASESYDVVNLKIAPVALKKPTLKCSKWVLSETIKDELPSLFK